ncbi:hypothetical protein AMV053 [Betaentomopoxvirus amoorei]|uniref:AMV053 n=1 Tax=Amsacta moorei entomopoxvirus TaxID=28321 RepID=Q9EMZ6_AMEPV|nr:hypothetical protein AMV053 [Amsacta moorei entomopoxvirus]AAG02759.1 AMV053 [Amsacta moorei entomopoxvirus]
MASERANQNVNTKKVSVKLNNEKTLEIYNNVINNDLFSCELLFSDMSDNLKEIINKYDNTINMLNNTFLVITRIKLYDININNDILVNYSNNIMTYTNKLFNDNVFVKEISNLNCDFNCNIDDSFYYKYNDISFILPFKSSEYITSIVCDKIKLVIGPLLDKYFRTLNDLIMYMYLYNDNKDILKSEKIDKIKFKCKNNFNDPKIIFPVIDKNEAGQSVIKFGDRRDKSKNKKVSLDKPKEKLNLNTLGANKNWDNIDESITESKLKDAKKKNNKKNSRIEIKKKKDDVESSDEEITHSNKINSNELEEDSD